MHLSSNSVYIVMMDVDPEVEDDFNNWLDQEHIPERLLLEGFRSARRFTKNGGSPRHVIMYELDDLVVLRGAPYLHLLGEGRSAWSKRMIPFLSNIIKYELNGLK